ncbi:MAG: flagellar biosynthetic protein FliO [Melioribacteraceae bacterium]|nr:flagellar biosynthetic protein FliO [Melioribacteraceae bacterium]
MTIWEMLTTILPLILILGLLYAALLFVRKSGFLFNKDQRKISQIKVISTQAIMSKKYISVVKVQGSFLVLGISDNSISLLKELDSIEEDISEDNEKEKKTFSEVFKQNLGIK